MATNTGSNGGKNNTGEIRTGANLNQGSGINAALNQANYRREYNEKMFSDSGYLSSSIKDLEKQAKELDRILKMSKDLTQSEKTRFSKMSADMKKLAAEQNEMFTKQEASSKELQSTLNESSRMRLKAVDELYRQYMKKEKDLNDIGRKQVENKIRQFAAASREIKADVEDINEATKNFDNAKKSLADGVGEFVDNLQSGLSDFIKVVSLNNLSSNEFLDKANERYKIMNKINSQLGYDATESTRTYNSLVSSFNNFNDNMNSLFNLDDLNQYIQDSNSLGIHSEKILQDTLQQSIIASKYLGLTVETQSSMYKYMKLTNSNDMIANYNKTMVALQKRHIGVSEDMLDQLVMQGTEVNDVLTAAGADVSKWNSGQQAFAGVLSSKGYTDDQIKQLTSGLNEAVINLTTTAGIGQLAQMGINPNSFKAAVSNGDYTTAMEMFVNGNNRMSSMVGNDISASGFLREQLGLNLGVTNTTNAVGKDLEGIREAVEGVLNDKEKLTEKDVRDVIENNKQQTWVQRSWNYLKGKVEEIFGGSGWLNFESLGTAAFALYIGATGWKALSSVISPLSGFLNGKGVAGSALGKLGSGLATVGLTAAAIAAIGMALKDKDVAAQSENEGLAASRTGNENSLSNKITGAGYTKDAIDWSNGWNMIGGGFSYLGHGIGMIFTNNSTKDKYNNLQTTLNHSDYSMDSKFRELATLAWMIAADNADVLSAIGESKENLINHLRKMDPNDFDTMVDGLAGEGKYKNLHQLLNGFTAPIGSDGTKYTADKMHVDDYYQYVGTDGYHLAGLDRVPKDNYRALLHKDEMVLNKAEAQRYRAILGKQGYGFGGSLNASAPDYVGAHHSGYAGHNGIDLYFSEIGTPVGSAVAGKVLESRDIPVDWNDGKAYHGADSNGTHYSSYGRVVKVKGDDGHTYIYGHLNERAVKAGDQVGAGTLLGYSGTTGNSSGPHLHFEVANAGTGEAAHAKYYTPYVRSANGAAAQAGVLNANSGDTNSDGSRRGAILATVNSSGVRAIPGFGGGSSSGPSSTDRIVKSVDGVSDKIIKYLNEIRQEQADQRRLINAFSASQTSIENYR